MGRFQCQNISEKERKIKRILKHNLYILSENKHKKSQIKANSKL